MPRVKGNTWGDIYHAAVCRGEDHSHADRIEELKALLWQARDHFNLMATRQMPLEDLRTYAADVANLIEQNLKP
jgi:hypothetical protein